MGKMKLLMGFLVLSLIISSPCHGQEWAKTYGGDNIDFAKCVRETADGNIIFAGATYSYQTNGVAWVVKLDSTGTMVWENTYGGPAGKGACCVDETLTQQGIADGYVVGGGPADDPLWSEFGVLRLNPDGTKVWQRVFGGFETTDTAYDIQQTSDQGYVICGYTESFNPPDGGHGWILKLDANAYVTWEYVYGGPAGMGARSIRETFDQQGNPDGYIVANGPSGAGGGDLGLLRLNLDGTMVWQKLYHSSGGAGHVKTVRQTSDGGFVLAGTAYPETGTDDFWVLRLNPDGSLLWSKTFGNSYVYEVDAAYSIEETSDNGFVVVGSTKSYGAGNEDFWVIKLDTGGTVAWQRTYGGANADTAYSVHETADGGFVVAGTTQSFGAGNEDAWVLRLNSNGEIPGCSAMGTSDVIGSDLFPEVYDVTWWDPFPTSAYISDVSWLHEQTLAVTTVVCSNIPICSCELVPDDPEPIVIPRGGTLGFQASVTNNTGGMGTVLFGTKVTKPDASQTGFIWGPLQVYLNPHQTKSGHKNHTIPVGFELGMYTYHGYVGRYGNIYDECQFDFEVVP